MVKMASNNCAICKNSKINLHKTEETIFGKQLLSIIATLCANEKAAQHHTNDKICTNCAIEVLHVDQVVSKIRNIFGKKPTKLNSDKKPKKLNADKTPTTATTTTTNADEFVFRCKTCGIETFKLKIYRQHMLKKHNETILKPYLCQICDDSFSRYDYYLKHQTLHHAVKEIIIKTELPDYNEYDEEHHEEFENVNNYNNENDNIDESDNKNNDEDIDEIFKCLECPYENDKPKVFKRHMLKVHNADKNNVFRCSKCPKSYGRLYAYKQHIEFVHNKDAMERLPKYDCNICGRRFFKSFGLLLHKKKHTQATTIIDEETMLNGATATSTPLNNKNNNNTTTKNNAVAENKQILSVKNASADSTPLPKRDNNSTEINQSAKNESILVVTNTDEKKRKHNVDADTVNPLKKKKAIEDDLEAEIKDYPQYTQEENGATENEEKHVCSYCKKTLSTSKKLARHISKKHVN